MKHLWNIMLLFPSIVLAQPVNTSYLANNSTDTISLPRYDLHVSSNHFVKNNEYFNPFTEGITYIGSMVQPEFSIGFGNEARLSLGWAWRYYYGTTKFSLSVPVVRFEYKPANYLSVTVGQLHSGIEHQLTEPLYSVDHYFSKNPEYGVQFRMQGQATKADVWMDWEHFLLPGEDQQERITGGLNFETGLKWHGLEWKLNVQGIVHHYGGQVVASDAPLNTRANLAPGILLVKDLSNTSCLISNITGATYYIQALDLSGKPQLPYRKGFASYSYVLVNAGWLKVMAAWFHGEYYFAPLGDPIFQSVSALNNWYHADARNLLNTKLILEKQLIRGVKGGMRFETYYDPALHNFDFCYGLNIRADACLFSR